jgi:hypothetical protein
MFVDGPTSEPAVIRVRRTGLTRGTTACLVNRP